MKEPIATLIKKAKQGDEKAFIQIYQESKWIILQVCTKYYFVEWDKDDMYQEAQIILYQSIIKCDINNLDDENYRNKFFGFYHKNLNNHFLNQWKKEHAQKRQHLFESVEYDDTFNDLPRSLNDKNEEYILTKVSINKLSQKYLTMEECKLISYRLEGHTIRECAKYLQHGPNYTNKLIKRIRKIFHQSQLFD